MKKQGRTTLICRKELSCGVMDMFEVVVASNERDIAKKKYESIGYHVSVKKVVDKWEYMWYNTYIVKE